MVLMRSSLSGWGAVVKVSPQALYPVYPIALVCVLRLSTRAHGPRVRSSNVASVPPPASFTAAERHQLRSSRVASSSSEASTASGR
jgi:hypothetical protein